MLVLAVALSLHVPAPARQAERSAWEQAHALGLAHVAESKAPRPRTYSMEEGAEHERAGWRRLERIQAELRSDDLPGWAGEYRFGRECLIWVAPDSGFAYVRYTHGWPTDANDGDVLAWSGNRLTVRFRHDPRRSWGLIDRLAPGCEEDWFLVTWDTETFLVPRSSLIGFCNAVNADTYRTRRFAARTSGTSRLPAAERGLPEVPEEHRPFLLERPLRGTLLEVGETECISGCDTDTPWLQATARVDLGARDALLPGMVLHAIDAGAESEGEVVAVEESQALVGFRFGAHAPSARRPDVGGRVSTRERDRERPQRTWRERLRAVPGKD